MKTALCSAVAALCAATLLSSIEAEGNLLLPALLPWCPADQQTSQSALSYWLSPSLFLSVNTSPSFFLSFRETPLLPCPAPSVFCFSRLVGRTVAPSLCPSGVLSAPPHRQDVGQLVWPLGRGARGALCHWQAARHGQGHGSAPSMDQEGLVSGLF